MKGEKIETDMIQCVREGWWETERRNNSPRTRILKEMGACADIYKMA